MLTQEDVISTMQEKGKAKYDKLNVGKKLSQTQAASILISKVICKEDNEGNSFHSSVTSFIEEHSPPSSDKAAIKNILKNMDSLVICIITAKHILDASDLYGTPLVNLCKNLGREIFLEARYQTFSKSNKKSLQSCLRRYKYAMPSASKKALLNVATNEGFFDDKYLEEGPDGATLQVKTGGYLINHFIESTGLVKKTRQKPLLSEKRHIRIRLELTPEAKELMMKMNESLRMHSVYYLPCVEKPTKWDESNTNLYDGSRTQWFKSFFLRGRISPMIKDFYKDPKNTHRLKMSFSSVNVLQEVPYRINDVTYSTLKTLYREHLDDNDCLLWHSYDMLEHELDFDAIRNAEEGSREKQEAVRIVREREELNIASNSKRRAIAGSLSVAGRYTKNDEIYFPHNVDYRCRIYPYTTGVSTQGADYQKSLLEYSQPTPIGSGNGGYWLAVHVANTFGNDKGTFEERVEWTERNTEQIIAYAENPLDNVPQWASADSPLCFLAACYEWKGYKEQGSEWLTRLPIAMDGKCNGLQHYAALLRDPDLADLVSVSAGNEPSKDIYTVVADNVQRRLLKYIEEEGLEENNRYANAANFMLSNGLVNRKLCKPPTMTLVYGVTYRGILGQCQSYIMQEMIRGDIKLPPECKSILGVCETAASTIYKALDEELGKAVKAMNFIKMASREMNKVGKTIKLEIPVTGFTMINSLEKRKSKTISIYNSGKEVRHKLWVGTNRPDNNRQVNASSPNFIHALDAAHLIITIDKLKARGITQVTAIHDSYAVPASQVDILHECIREAFVELHSYPIWEDFKRSIKEGIGDVLYEKLMKKDDLESHLKLGNFDINEVFDSKYFFS